MKHDITGQEIKVGDYAIYTTATEGMKVGKVQKLTAKRAEVHYKKYIPFSHIVVLQETHPNYSTIVDEVEQKIHEYTERFLKGY